MIHRLRIRCKQQEHGGRVEQQRNHENEPSQDRLVVGAHRAKVGLDGATLAFHSGLLDFQVGKVNNDGGRGAKTEDMGFMDIWSG